MIEKLLKKADRLVQPYEFNIKNKSKSHTPIGGFLYILIIISATFYILGVVLKQLNTQEAIYAGSQSDLQDTFSLTPANSVFTLEISTLNGQIISDLEYLRKYIDIKAQFIQQTRTKGQIGFQRNYKTLDLVKCPNETITALNFQAASFTDEQKMNLICFAGNYSIAGQFYDPAFNYVSITISVCNSSQSECQSKEAISDFISKGVNVDLFVKDSQIKQKLNISEPARTFPTNIYWRLTTAIANNEDIYLAPVQFDQKKNQIFSELLGQNNVQHLFNSSQFSRQERRQSPITINNGTILCTFYFRASSDSLYYFILQQDVFTILLSSVSEATALALAVIEFIKIFYQFYNQHKTFELLMNSVFKFDLQSIRQRRETTLTPYDRLIDSMKKNKEKNQIKLNDLLNFTISYSFFDYLYYKVLKVFSCLRKKNFFKLEKEIVISQIAKQKIEFDLDLTNILKKLYEIDCLKLFLFDDDQMMLFNSFCSPVFQDGMIQQKDLLFQQKRSLNRFQNNPSIVSKGKDPNADKVDYTFVATSDIPLNIRLQKVARFFKAQLEADNEKDLIDTFRKVKLNKNQNKALNQQLINFAKQNSALYKLVSQLIQEDDVVQIDDRIPDELGAPKTDQQRQSDMPILSKEKSDMNVQSIEIDEINSNPLPHSDEGRMSLE